MNAFARTRPRGCTYLIKTRVCPYVYKTRLTRNVLLVLCSLGRSAPAGRPCASLRPPARCATARLSSVSHLCSLVQHQLRLIIPSLPGFADRQTVVNSPSGPPILPRRRDRALAERSPPPPLKLPSLQNSVGTGLYRHIARRLDRLHPGRFRYLKCRRHAQAYRAAPPQAYLGRWSCLI